jgi:hypothetical protein
VSRPASRAERKLEVTKAVGSARESRAEVPDGLDWRRFRAAYFPGSRRHNFKAIVAYGAYKRSARLTEPFRASSRRKFTEPVALSSTQPTDLPLPRRAFRLSFDLLALRARCVKEPMGREQTGQASRSANWRSLRSSSSPAVGARLMPTAYRHGPSHSGVLRVSDLCQITLTIVAHPGYTAEA